MKKFAGRPQKVNTDVVGLDVHKDVIAYAHLDAQGAEPSGTPDPPRRPPPPTRQAPPHGDHARATPRAEKKSGPGSSSAGPW